MAEEFTQAYVVLDVEGDPLPNTCHEHARGAMVNWLWLAGVRVPADLPDEVIRMAFCEMTPKLGVKLALVEMRKLDTPDPATVPLLAVPG